MEALYGSLKGVVRTRAEYAGGTKENPTYYSLGDHSETVQIDYDPSVIPYGELLDMFWAYHDPTEPSSCQYAAIVFCHNEKQRMAAEDSKDRLERRIGRTVLTQVRHYGGFYLAEDYHQKFLSQGDAGILQGDVGILSIDQGSC